MNRVQSSAAAVRRYVLLETLTATIIAVVLSMVFAWLFFGGRHDLTLQTPEFVRDTAIQGFIVPFWIVLPVTIIGRYRLRAGRAPRCVPWGRWPKNAFVRALLFGILTAIVLGLVHRVVASSLPSVVLSVRAMLAFKGAIGAIIAIFVAPLAARASLVDDGVPGGIKAVAGTAGQN